MIDLRGALRKVGAVGDFRMKVEGFWKIAGEKDRLLLVFQPSYSKYSLDTFGFFARSIEIYLHTASHIQDK